MSDSVLSLKQAVNSWLGKNHLGTFYAPQFVWADLAYLDTLPNVEIHAALCGLIKNILAICPEHYDEVAALLRPSGSYTDDEFLRIVALSLAAKGTAMRRIESRDPQPDQGLGAGRGTAHSGKRGTARPHLDTAVDQTWRPRRDAGRGAQSPPKGSRGL